MSEREAIVAMIRHYFAAVDDDLHSDVQTLCGRIERGEHMPSEQDGEGGPVGRAAIEKAIREFPFDNFGMDDVTFALEADPEAQEWVPALAKAIHEAVVRQSEEAS